MKKHTFEDNTMSVIPLLLNKINLQDLEGQDIKSLIPFAVFSEYLSPVQQKEGVSLFALQLLALQFHLGEPIPYLTRDLWRQGLEEAIEDLNNERLEKLYKELELMMPEDEFEVGRAVSPGRRIEEYNTNERLNEWRLIHYSTLILSLQIERETYRLKSLLNTKIIKEKLFNTLDLIEESEKDVFDKSWSLLIS